MMKCQMHWQSRCKRAILLTKVILIIIWMEETSKSKSHLNFKYKIPFFQRELPPTFKWIKCLSQNRILEETTKVNFSWVKSNHLSFPKREVKVWCMARKGFSISYRTFLWISMKKISRRSISTLQSETIYWSLLILSINSTRN